IFITDLHQLQIMAVVESYQTFKVGAPLPVTDMADSIARTVEHSFLIGFQMSIPFIVSGMLFALALGLLSRLAPQIQVFFLFMSVQVALGLFLFAVAGGVSAIHMTGRPNVGRRRRILKNRRAYAKKARRGA
ncbi:flagellar biosynthetic protein FliR, partial [bacterium]|nr:flagellar biosynthetic protein FliR [bacterium]